MAELVRRAYIRIMVQQNPSQPDPHAASIQPVSISMLTPPQIIQHYSDDEWEEFVLESLEGSNPKYARLERRAGAGDKGRDVIAYTVEPPIVGQIDVYQCKAYGKPLGVSDIWVELGKLCVFTHRGDYPVPRRYCFAAPHNVTTPLGNLLDKPSELNKKLIEKWASQCESKVSQGQTFPLEAALKKYVEQFDFSIVHYSPVNEILKLHRSTSHWHERFRRDYPVRPPADTPPQDLCSHELRYVRQLLDAYGQHMGGAFRDSSELKSHQTLSEHFHGCRTDFFMADGLNRFYRDQFPEGAFGHVKDQVHQGVRNTVLAPHENGYHRVCATLAQAAKLGLAQTDYVYCVQPGDKSGLCHHLANEDKIFWVQL